jgi:hypothetical protein
MRLVPQHLELINILIDVSLSHLEFLKVIIGLLLLGIVYKGSFEVLFEYCLGGPSIEFL